MSTPQLVDWMTKHPQRCIVTGAGNRPRQGQVLDLGVVLPNYGRVYISDIGLQRLAAAAGFVPAPDPDAADPRDARIAELLTAVAERDELLARIPAILERTLNGLRELSVAAAADLLDLGDGGPDDLADPDEPEHGEGALGDHEPAVGAGAGPSDPAVQ